MTLTQYLGDSVAHEVPLRWKREAFTPGADWTLIFTAKLDPADLDSAAVIQKASGIGITTSGATATVATVPADTSGLPARDLFWDIQAQHVETGEVRTVAVGMLRLSRDATRLTATSIDIYTTHPPFPGAGGDVAGDTHASPSKAVPVDADEMPLVDSAAEWVLKKLTWGALKAALKSYFDTLYQAAGLTWETLSGKPSTFAPGAHKASHATGGADALTPADIGAQPAGSYAPATGISPSAIAGTAVITTDARLSDSRNPTAHTHVSADITDATSTATPSRLVLRAADGGAAFAGLNTNSGSYSQVGGANFNVATSAAANLTATGAGTVTVSGAAGTTISGGTLTFSPSGFTYGAGAAALHRTALELGTAASPTFAGADFLTASSTTINVYNTLSGANFERLSFRWLSNVARIGTSKGGTSTARDMVFETDGTERVRVTAAGSVTLGTASAGSTLSFVPRSAQNISQLILSTASDEMIIGDTAAGKRVIFGGGAQNNFMRSSGLSTTGLVVGSTSSAVSGVAYIAGTVGIGISAPTAALDVVGSIKASGTVQTGGYTFATLPTPSAGMRAYITDGAASPVFMATAAGGGSTVTPVFYNGSAWVNC
jgi:hypothetical protein